MSVVGGGVTFLFCEGQSDPEERTSLDNRLLNRLLQGRPTTAAIMPAGGKHQLRAFIRGRLAAEKTPPKYLAFRDRDFDAEPTANVSLIQFRSGEPIYMSHRTAIENYLLAVDLIHSYWNKFYETGPTWKHGQPPGVEEIRAWMVEAAGKLIVYQAARWALASLKTADRWPEVRTTWTKGSGHLPPSLEETNCLDHAKKLVRDFGSVTAKVSESNVLESYRRFLDRFSTTEFLTRSEYLVWFQGKDLLKQMQRLRPTSISLEHFCGWAVENVDWKQHADLQELAGKIP